nr:hypothetical protein [Tanacetum cinerariifolium]
MNYHRCGANIEVIAEAQVFRPAKRNIRNKGLKNFTPTAASILGAVTKVDSNYYPETLHQMFVVNASSTFKKYLWPAAQKFLDTKTIPKIQVNCTTRKSGFDDNTNVVTESRYMVTKQI